MNRKTSNSGDTGVRRASPDDLERLVPLVADYWRFEDLSGFDADEVAAQIEYLMSDPRLGDVWVFADGENLAGYLVAVYVFSLEHKGLTAEIDEFYVLPELRSRGIGQALLAAAEARFSELRCTNVSLQLGRENSPARLFYQERGYSDRRGFELLDKHLPKAD